MEEAESEDASVEIAIATLEATSLNDGDLKQMTTELFDILARTVKDEARTSNCFNSWERMVARYAPTNPSTALVPGRASSEPAKADRDEGVGGAPLRRWSCS